MLQLIDSSVLQNYTRPVSRMSTAVLSNESVISPSPLSGFLYTEVGKVYENRPVENSMLHDILMPQHLLIILIVALFIFGPKKLPELGHGLGKGIRSFKDSLKSVTSSSEEPATPETPTAAKTSEAPK